MDEPNTLVQPLPLEGRSKEACELLVEEEQKQVLVQLWIAQAQKSHQASLSNAHSFLYESKAYQVSLNGAEKRY